MTDQDRDRFEGILIGLAEIFDKQLSEGQLDLYFGALSDMSIEDVVQAGNILARSVKFFPKPVEFRESMAINTDDMAAIAYAKFAKGCHQTPSKTLIFDDPIIHAVIVNLGGWNDELYDRWANIKDEVWLRKDFERLYQTYAKMGVPDNTPEKLVGKYELNNEGRWDWATPQPALIGSKDSPILQKALKEYKEERKALKSGEDTTYLMPDKSKIDEMIKKAIKS